MSHVVVVGGGFGGIAAALTASLTFVALQKRTFVHVVEVAPEGGHPSMRLQLPARVDADRCADPNSLTRPRRSRITQPPSVALDRGLEPVFIFIF